MKARLTLKPGQRGTKKLMARYGDALLYVRYRYDPVRKKRVKTVELILEEIDWEPPVPKPAPDQIVGIRVTRDERSLRTAIKKAGGTWNWHRRVWEVCYAEVVRLELEERIVEGS